MRLSIQKKGGKAQSLDINSWAYWLYIGFLCLMLYARDVLSVPVPLLVFLIYFAAGYLSMDYDHALALTAMLPLLNHGVQTNYITIMAIVMYLYKFGAGLRLNAMHGILLVLMLLELLHMGIEPFSMAEYVRYVAQYMYLALILGESRLKNLLKDPIVVLRTFIFIATYFMLDVIMVTAKYIPLEDVLFGDFRFGVLDEFMEKKATLYDNENMVGLFALMSIGFLGVCMVKTRKHIIRDSLLIAYFIYFGLLTQSKTFLICLIIETVLFAVYFLYVARKSAGKMLLIILGGTLLVYLAVNVFFPDVMAGVLERFEAEDLSTGRDNIFRYYNELIVSRISITLFGIGLQSVQQKTGFPNVPHNGFQEIVVCWGFIGLILMLCLLYGLIKRPSQYAGRKIPWCYYFPLVGYMAVIQTMQFVRLSAIFNSLIPLFIAIYLGGAPDAGESIPDHS